MSVKHLASGATVSAANYGITMFSRQVFRRENGRLRSLRQRMSFGICDGVLADCHYPPAFGHPGGL